MQAPDTSLEGCKRLCWAQGAGAHMLLQRGARGGSQPRQGRGSRARILQVGGTAHTLQHLHSAKSTRSVAATRGREPHRAHPA